ncbi:MAG: IS1380 family transposase, partial [Oleispira sp.]|nr:IS1380 family transposase [Oleispira sp.]
MQILPYKLATTNDKLTSRAGLVVVAQLMNSLDLAKSIDKHFPAPKSNRGFSPSIFIQTFILMQHEGSFHLDDVRNISDDQALRMVLGLNNVPQPSTQGAWLRQMGESNGVEDDWASVNKELLAAALHKCKGITLDIGVLG